MTPARSPRAAPLAAVAWLAAAACAPLAACTQGEIDLLPGPSPMPHMMPAPCPAGPAGPAGAMACDDAGACPMMQRCDPATNRCVRPDCVSDAESADVAASDADDASPPMPEMMDDAPPPMPPPPDASR